MTPLYLAVLTPVLVSCADPCDEPRPKYIEPDRDPLRKACRGAIDTPTVLLQLLTNTWNTLLAV